MDSTAQIQRITDKLQRLLVKFREAQHEATKLSKINGSLQLMIKEKNQEIQNLQQMLEGVRLTSINLNDDVKKDLEKRITVYLKEIDNCLALLNG